MTTSAPLAPAELRERHAEIEAALDDVITRRRSDKTQPLAVAVKAVFERLFAGRRHARDRAQFFLFVAPIMRRLTIQLGRTGQASGTLNLTALELEKWLTQLEGFDPECVRMIDLRYFTGLSTRETASILGLSPHVVIRDLRFAKAWLQARVRWAMP